MSRLVLWMLIGMLAFPGVVVADEQRLPQPASLPVEVTARQLEADQQQRQAVFTGEVVAKQGDITLYCEKLVVYSRPDEDRVDRLEAFGDVRVVQLDRIATADRAIYQQEKGTLVLFGNARVHQGQNQVAGEEITVFLQEDRSVVKSSETGRVKAILFPKQEQQ